MVIYVEKNPDTLEFKILCMYRDEYLEVVTKLHEYHDIQMMKFAREYSVLATCKKKKLGCVLDVSKGKWLSGWNGPPIELSRCNPCSTMGMHNGEGMHLCKAVHAERRVLLDAARNGVSVYGSTLYSDMGVPCKDCMVELIEAGVKEIVCSRETYYDELSKDILKEWTEKGGIFRIVRLTDEFND